MKRLLAVIAVLGLSAATLFGCATIRSASDVQPFADRAGAGDQTSVDALINALRSKDKTVREAAYSALTGVGGPAVPKLIETLKDKDADMREYAAGALGNIGDKRAVGPLMDMLKTERERRYIAAWALGEVDAVEAVDMLIDMLGELNDALQKESTRALIKIGGNAVPTLISALDSPLSDRRKYSCRALGVIQDHRAEEPLIKRIDDENNDVAAAAALALGTAGTKTAIPHLVKALGSDHMITRVNASIALGQLDAKDAVGPLEKIMTDDADPHVREWSARALENITGNRYKYKNEKGDMVFPYNLYR